MIIAECEINSSSHVTVDLWRRDGGLLLRRRFHAEPDIVLRVRGTHVPRYLAGLLRNRRHVPDESQVSRRLTYLLEKRANTAGDA